MSEDYIERCALYGVENVYHLGYVFLSLRQSIFIKAYRA